MRFIKLYESFEDIDSICKKYGIKNYTINKDGSVDVDDDIYLNCRDITKLPLKFGNVSGDFICYENKLTKLEGCPQSVGGNFDFSDNKLTTLEGCPQSVGGYFGFSDNQIKDLYGFPEFFDNEIYYSQNPVSEILDLFKNKRNRLGKVIDLLNEYGAIQQDGKVVILDRLEEVFHTLNLYIPEEIKLSNYEVY